MIISANLGIPGSPPPCPEGSRLLAAMDVEWSKNYRSRAKVLELQPAADRIVRSVCATVGQHVIDVPPNMATSERVKWIASRVSRLGILGGFTAE